MKLFTVGPVACRQEILDEMSTQMFSHRSERYRKLQRDTISRLKDFMGTDGEVLLFPSSGSGVMESSIRNCVEDKMLVTVNGAFGERFAEVGRACGADVELLKTEKGVATKPDMLDEKLSSNPDVEAVSITYNDTSVGLLNPLPDLAEVVKDHDKLLLVDAVTAVGGARLKADEWNLDVSFASSQKCLGIPPGLAFANVSEEALEKSEQMDGKGWYFDLAKYKDYNDRKSGTPSTPPIPQVLALNKRLELIEEKGKEEHFEMYQERNKRIREGVKDLGLSLFPEEGYRSPTVTCVNAPEHKTGFEVYKEMQDKGFELAKGYGDLQEESFRIGNMGHVPFENIEDMLDALEEVVEK